MFLVLHNPEPSHQGKTLTEWISGFEYLNYRITDEQRSALLTMGEPAIRRLTDLLKKRDSGLKRKFVAYASRTPSWHNRILAPRHIVSERVYLAQAASAIGEFGPAASSAIPALTALTTHDELMVRLRAKAALIRIRQEPIDSILAVLQDTTSTNWGRTAYLAMFLGTNAAPAGPLFIAALQSPKAHVRDVAAGAISCVGMNPETAVPALISCLKDADPDVRRSAVDSLRTFKSQKQRIIPELLSCLSDSDLNVWLGAAFGLEDLLSPAEKQALLVPALKGSLQHQDTTIRANAKLFLERIPTNTAAETALR